ncbi:MAG: Ppx/GppA phosphatase [Deltaproteobacteria bacterium]|jgi:exopolyphosphatase/guanosine-5'-triphosphate,3'-diphosphate pyrophosphatase|nr:Ppx/GppA phosphatase [Deltaproteobacteria bacterium]
MPPLASVDIGSNTLRLLIAEGWTSGPLKPIRVERRITRLGERFLPTRILQPPAMARSIAALREFAQLMAENGVQDYLAAATAVVREAGNGAEFLRRVEEEAGLRVRLLSGTEEAELALRGAALVTAGGGAPIALFDIGGGSTEVIRQVPGGSPGVESVSLPIGVVHLTETFLRDDPPGLEACARLAGHVRAILEAVSFAAPLDRLLWVGTAGTVTTLAAMYLELQHYDPDRINGVVLERSWLVDLCNRLADTPVASRRAIVGLEPGREDIILAGALVILELMETFRFSRVTVSDAGLLEGLFLELCQRHRGLSLP